MQFPLDTSQPKRLGFVYGNDSKADQGATGRGGATHGPPWGRGENPCESGGGAEERPEGWMAEGAEGMTKNEMGLVVGLIFGGLWSAILLGLSWWLG